MLHYSRFMSGEFIAMTARNNFSKFSKKPIISHKSGSNDISPSSLPSRWSRYFPIGIKSVSQFYHFKQILVKCRCGQSGISAKKILILTKQYLLHLAISEIHFILTIRLRKLTDGTWSLKQPTHMSLPHFFRRDSNTDAYVILAYHSSLISIFTNSQFCF